jgi:hypothetical protein
VLEPLCEPPRLASTIGSGSVREDAKARPPGRVRGDRRQRPPRRRAAILAWATTGEPGPVSVGASIVDTGTELTMGGVGLEPFEW